MKLEATVGNNMYMCVRPMNVKGNVVPCGKCFECHRDKRNSWAIRLQHELKEGMFITVTYNKENYPGQLEKTELQQYIKNVREQIRRIQPKFKLTYFAVGEYGDRRGRAHYHIITNSKHEQIWKDKWNKGFLYFGNVEDASILYTTKYIQKKKIKSKIRVPEFRIMSKKIGQIWLEKYGDYYRRNRLLHTLQNGQIYPLPRYYRDKLFNTILTKEKEDIWLYDIYIKEDGKIIRKLYKNKVGQTTKYRVNKETGEIQPGIVLQEKYDLRDKIEEKQLKKIKQLAEKYKTLLHKEINENYVNRFEKYQKMYETLRLKNSKSTEQF